MPVRTPGKGYLAHKKGGEGVGGGRFMVLGNYLKLYAYTMNLVIPLSSESGAYSTFRTRFCSWLSGESPENLLSDSIFALLRVEERQRVGGP